MDLPAAVAGLTAHQSNDPIEGANTDIGFNRHISGRVVFARCRRRSAPPAWRIDRTL
ncbi:hypothetical protein [Krasilnikovia sp. M28-CT-15]|uniref:hypothetical protein n=1 Tax=Krasilnikovia sp. M28-CT-15 TaxID=3373540 RepID=UPI0038768BB7